MRNKLAEALDKEVKWAKQNYKEKCMCKQPYLLLYVPPEGIKCSCGNMIRPTCTATM